MVSGLLRSIVENKPLSVVSKPAELKRNLKESQDLVTGVFWIDIAHSQEAIDRLREMGLKVDYQEEVVDIDAPVVAIVVSRYLVASN